MKSLRRMKVGKAVKQHARRFAIILTVLVFLGLLMGGVMVEISAKPKFCNNCHVMTPYYNSWKKSKHNEVPCIECHYEPGVVETFQGKFKAVSQVAKYVTGTEGTKPWAEVSDDSCTRVGCHSEKLLQGPIKFKRVNFDHRHHLLELRRGKRLRCTSCHSQIVQDEHIAVTESVCFICHFKKSGKYETVSACTTCHDAPTTSIQLGEFTFRHSEYLKRGVECLQCHGDVTRGTGEVPKERCGSCHNKVEHLERYKDTEFLHDNHVAKHKVDCLECHREIEHGLTERAEHVQTDCDSCHKALHDTQERMYAGVGMDEFDSKPSVMYLARVTCNGCHWPALGKTGPPAHAETFKATDVSCMSCHGIGYEKIMYLWQDTTREAHGKLGASLEKLQDAIGDAAGQSQEVEKARRFSREAEHELAIVAGDGSWGVHNMEYAQTLLQDATSKINAALALVGIESKPVTIDVAPKVTSKSNCTTLCHMRIEKQSIGYEDTSFDHSRHVMAKDMDCDACHSVDKHGVTNIRKADCNTCHHKRVEAECTTCHSAQRRMLFGGVEDVDKSENVMAGIGCDSCHQNISERHALEDIKQSCVDCHDENYGALVDEWRGELNESMERIKPLLTEISSALQKGGGESKRVAKVRELIDKADQSFTFVRNANGAHNYDYSTTLLNEAEKSLQECRRLLSEKD